MTGFGRGGAQTPTRRVKVEIKSLNSKQLDLSMRVPSCFREMEVTMRNGLAQRLERGKVELNATVENIVAETTTTVNVELLAQYKGQLEELGRRLDLPEPADWYSLLLRMPESMKVETAVVDASEMEAFRLACEEAVDALTDFRRKEGRKLYAFFIEKIGRLRTLLSEIEPYESERVPKIRERLEEQLSKMTSMEYDKGRLEQ